MCSGYLDSVDWTRPWLSHLLPFAERIKSGPDWKTDLNDLAAELGLRNAQGLPIRFADQSELPAGMAYETYIGGSGRVPTRDNLHDFFNGLIWLGFPKTKARLNALQVNEISKGSAGTQPGSVVVRGKLRDAVTIFDENAALLLASDPQIISAIRAHEWREVFLSAKTEFDTTWSVFLFGHALLEKLTQPFKAITAHAWPLLVDKDFFSMPIAEQRAHIDSWASEKLSASLTNADFMPLPVLGTPGWWVDQDENFYSDKSVFRPKRSFSQDKRKN